MTFTNLYWANVCFTQTSHSKSVVDRANPLFSTTGPWALFCFPCFKNFSSFHLDTDPWWASGPIQWSGRACNYHCAERWHDLVPGNFFLGGRSSKNGRFIYVIDMMYCCIAWFSPATVEYIDTKVQLPRRRLRQKLRALKSRLLVFLQIPHKGLY